MRVQPFMRRPTGKRKLGRRSAGCRGRSKKGGHVHYDASLRVRDLTQNIYDIGDEIAEHIEHIAQAIADWDGELVEDCVPEFASVVRQGRKEVRPGLAELNGLRQALSPECAAERCPILSTTLDAPCPFCARAHPHRRLTALRLRPGRRPHRSALTTEPGRRWRRPPAGGCGCASATRNSSASWRSSPSGS